MVRGRGRGRGRGRARAGRRKPWYMRKRVGRKPVIHTFTETLQASPLPSGGGGIFSTRFNDLPQAAQYATLWKQFCIRKLEVMIVPKFNSFGVTGNVANSYWQPRITYAVNDTPSLLTPATELDVLTDNGCKTKVINNKPLRITCYPKPEFISTDLTGARVVTRQRKMIWFNTGNTDVAFSGQNVVHTGIQYFVTGNTPGAPVEELADVYYKVTISMRDAS